MTRYDHQIAPYFEFFPPENVMLLVMEEYVRDQAGTLDRLARFLDVGPLPAHAVDTSARHRSVGVEYGTYRLRKLHGSRWFLALRLLFPRRLRAAVKQRWFKRRLDEKPEFPPELRRRLWERLEPEVAGIEARLGRRLDVWRDRPA
jgi:hypothetical protein